MVGNHLKEPHIVHLKSPGTKLASIYSKRASTSLISLALLYLYYYACLMSSLAPARTRFHISAHTRFHFSSRPRFHISARTRFHISARTLHLISHASHSERSAMSSSPLALVKWTAEGLRTSHTKAFY